MRLTRSGLKTLSVVCANFAAVFLGSLVLPVFIGDIEINRWSMLTFGVLGTGGFSYLAILFAERGKL